jgi:hypothetical protein
MDRRKYYVQPSCFVGSDCTAGKTKDYLQAVSAGDFFPMKSDTNKSLGIPIEFNLVNNTF